MAKRDDQNEDEQKNENLNSDSDDSFGLPEIEYQPIQKKEEPVEEPAETESAYESQSYDEPSSSYEEEVAPVEEEPTYRYKPYEEEESSIWPKIIGILAVLVVALGATWYFVIYQPKQKAEAEKTRIEAEQRAAAKKAQEEEENRLRLEREAAEKRRLDSLEAIKTPPVGNIETLSGRTGRYYVVIASAIDKDLLMDYAKKLSAGGVSSKIIPPYGKHLVSRITIAEGDSFADAQAKADALKAEYGDAVWVLRY
jgi:hypothetical protein